MYCSCRHTSIFLLLLWFITTDEGFGVYTEIGTSVKYWCGSDHAAAWNGENWHLRRRYRLIAWFKNPLPGTPFNSEVIGIKDIEITSGWAWTVLSHSPWDIKPLSLPLLRLGIITRSCHGANKNVCHMWIYGILHLNKHKHHEHKTLYLIWRVRI